MFARRNRSRLQPLTETDRAAVAEAMAEIGGVIAGRVPDRTATLHRQLAAMLLTARRSKMTSRAAHFSQPKSPL